MTERRLIVRRLYDEPCNLIADDWRRRDNVHTLYHGVRPQLQLSPEKRGSLPLDSERVWQLHLSAKEFASLVGNTDMAHVESW